MGLNVVETFKNHAWGVQPSWRKKPSSIRGFNDCEDEEVIKRMSFPVLFLGLQI